MKSKKGDVELSTGTLIEMIILLIVCGLIVLVIAKESSSYQFEKLFLSKDTAMFVDTLYASPNKIEVMYPPSVSIKDFTFIFEKNQVRVYQKEEIEDLAESYYFTEEKDIDFRYGTIKPLEVVDDEITTPIIFIKTKSKLTPQVALLTKDVLE